MTEDTRLDAQLTDHRAMYKADLMIPRLVSRQPPTTVDPNTGELHVEDGTRIGMTMSGPLLKYLGHPEGYGQDYQWTRALYRLRSWCRKEHRRRYHSTEKHWNGSLCHQSVVYAVIHGWSVENVGLILDYTDPESILRDALHFIEDTLDDFRRLQEKRAREAEGHAMTCACGHSWSRHDNPATMFACATCECSRYRAESKAA